MARHDWEWAIGIRMQADIPCRRAPIPFPARLVDLPRFAGRRRRAANRGSDRPSFVAREINSCRVQPNSSASSEMRHTRMSRSFGSTVPSRRSGGESVRLFRDAAPISFATLMSGSGQIEVAALRGVRSAPNTTRTASDVRKVPTSDIDASHGLQGLRMSISRIKKSPAVSWALVQ